MKTTRFITLFGCLIYTSSAFAQTPAAIEADLLTSFKKIGYWSEHQERPDASEQLEKANKTFADNLQSHAQKVPTTIKLPFKSLVKEHLEILNSEDGLLRIYSWDTETGGTMHFFENVFQYQVGDRTLALIDTPKTEGDTGLIIIKYIH